MAEISKDVNTDVDLVYEALEQLRKIMTFDNNGTSSTLVEFFRFCAGFSTSTSPISSATITSAPQSSTTEPDENEDDQHPWMNVTSPEECNEAYRKFKNHINDVIFGRYGHIKEEQEFFVMAEQYDDSVNNLGSTKYPECFTLIEEGKVILDSFDTALGLVSTLTEVDIDEGLTIVEELMDHLEHFNISESIRYFDSRLNQTCGWRKDFSEEIRKEAEMYKAYITQGRFSILEMETPLVRYFVIAVFREWSNTFDVEKYLAKNITKQELAEQFLSVKNMEEIEDFSENISEMEDLMNQYRDRIFESVDFLQEGYVSLSRQNPVIIINDSSIQHLHVIQKALTNDWLARFARRGSLVNTIYHIAYELEWGPISDINVNVTEPIRTRLQQLNTIETNLSQYQDSIKMDTHFYLCSTSFPSFSFPSPLFLTFSPFSFVGVVSDFRFLPPT